MYLEYEFYQQEEIIYDIDQRCDQFLIILQGEIIMSNYLDKDIILSDGQFFGEEIKTNHIAKCVQNTHLMKFNHQLYQDYVREEKLKIKEKEMNYLHENFFFSPITKYNFQKYYYNKFTLEELNRGNIIFREGDQVKYLYIIKEGTVELSIHKNFLELHNIIKQLMQENENLMNTFQNEYEYETKNKQKNFMDKLTKKSTFSIFKLKSLEMLGVKEINFGFCHLYKATVISDKTKIYKIDIETVKSILEDEKKSEEVFRKFAMAKITSFIERLIYIRNSILKIFDKEFSQNSDHVIEDKDYYNKDSAKKKIKINSQLVKQFETNKSFDFYNKKEIETNSATKIISIIKNVKIDYLITDNSENENSKISDEKDKLRESRIFIFEDKFIKNLKEDWNSLQKNIQSMRKFKNGEYTYLNELDEESQIVSKSTTNKSKIVNRKISSNLYLTERPINSGKKLIKLTKNSNKFINELPNLQEDISASPTSLVNLLPDITKYTNRPYRDLKAKMKEKSFISEDKRISLKNKYASPIMNKHHKIMKNRNRSTDLMNTYMYNHEDSFNYLKPKEGHTIAKVKEYYLKIKLDGYKNKRMGSSKSKNNSIII